MLGSRERFGGLAVLKANFREQHPLLHTAVVVALLAVGCGSHPRLTVTYDGNGNSGGSVPVDATPYQQGQSVTVLGNTGNLENTGYEFGGWNTAKDATGTNYAPMQTFFIEADVTLYANWSTGSYCFIEKYDSSGTVSWLVKLAAASSSVCQGVAVDASGDSYVVGYAELPAQRFAGLSEAFIAKITPSGAFQWMQTLLPDVATSPTSVAVDSLGNSYMVGGSGAGLPISPFLAKYDSSGTFEWLQNPGVGSQEIPANVVAADSSGNSYVVGSTTQGLNGNIQAGVDDYFNAKYDSTGTLLWLRQLGVTSQLSYGFAVAADSFANSYVVGGTTGGLNGNVQTGFSDYFMAKYDSSGTLLWLRQLGAASADSYARGVAVDSSGNSYVVGDTFGGLNGNTQTGLEESFIAKYDSAGTLLWLRQLSAVASQASYADGVTVDSAGDSYVVVGSTSGGQDGNTQTGSEDFFVAKYDSSGTLLWLRELGAVASQDSYGSGVAVDSSGNSYFYKLRL
jgi:hypothetical protein